VTDPKPIRAEYSAHDSALVAIACAVSRIVPAALGLMPTTTVAANRAARLPLLRALIDDLEDLSTLIVFAETRRGTSWELIAMELGDVTPRQVADRFGPAVLRLHHAALRYWLIGDAGALRPVPPGMLLPAQHLDQVDDWVRHSPPSWLPGDVYSLPHRPMRDTVQPMGRGDLARALLAAAWALPHHEVELAPNPADRHRLQLGYATRLVAYWEEARDHEPPLPDHRKMRTYLSVATWYRDLVRNRHQPGRDSYATHRRQLARHLKVLTAHTATSTT